MKSSRQRRNKKIRRKSRMVLRSGKNPARRKSKSGRTAEVKLPLTGKPSEDSSSVKPPTEDLKTKQRSTATFYDRALVETTYAVQNHRIKAGNRVQAYIRSGMDKAKAESLHQFVDKNLETMEADLRKMVDVQIKGHPFYQYWLKSVRGIGPMLAGSLIAAIEPISRFDNISKLWRYAGLAVFDGKAERMKKGEKIHWSPFLKTTCWKLGEQFVKQGDYYRKVYDEEKQKYREKFPKPVDKKYSDGHIHAMAKRKAVKLFMSHCWVKWREMEGLPVTEPYAISILKHTGLLKP